MNWWHLVSTVPVVLSQPETNVLDDAVQLCLDAGMSPDEIVEACRTETEKVRTRAALTRVVSLWPRELEQKGGVN